jgi:O-antigen/teichoic acid export membrane protein
VKNHLFALSGQTLVYGLAGVAVSVVGLVTLPVFARSLTISEYGALELMIVAVSALGIFVDLGLASASQRSYFDYAEKERGARGRVLLTAILTSLSIALAFTAIVVAFAGPIAEALLGDADDRSLVIVSVIALPVGVLAQFWREVMRLTVRPWHYAVSSIVTAVAGGALGIVAVVAFDSGPTGVQVGGLIGAAAAALYGAVVVWRDVGPGFSVADLKVMLRYGLPLVPTGAALWGISLLDRIILSRIDTLAEVGRYGVANRVAGVLMLAVVAFQTAYVPFFLSMNATDPKGEKALRARVLVYFGLALFLPALAMSLFAEEAITIVAPGYEDAAPSAVILLFAIALFGIGSVGLAGISIARATGYIALHTGTALALNVVLCLALIPPLGEVGAALATAAAYALLAVLYFRTSQRLDPAPFDFRRVITIVVVTSVAACVAFLPIEPEGVAAAAMVATFAVAVAALWPLGVIGPMEREFLRSLLRRSSA